MATLCGVTLVKKFTYRDDPEEEFSNQYWFKGAPPSDTASWQQMVIDVLNLEIAVMDSGVTYTRAYGYNDDDPTANHVYAKDFTVPGPPPQGQRPTTGYLMAGDQAALVSWKTGTLNKRGKPIYLRKYFHHGNTSISDIDKLDPAYLTVLETFAAAMKNHYGGLTNPTSENHPGGSETAETAVVSPWVTTRTLKRRGKRPKAAN